MNFVASALIEPGLERGWVFFQQMGRERERAYLDPGPDSGEECGSVYDGDCVERFWVVGGGQFRGLLEVAAKRPHQTKGNTAEVNDRGS